MAGKINVLMLLSMGCVALSLGAIHVEERQRYKLNCPGRNFLVQAEMPLDIQLRALCNAEMLVPDSVESQITMDYTITVTASLNCTKADAVVITQEKPFADIGTIVLTLPTAPGVKQQYCKLGVKIEATHDTMEKMVFNFRPIPVILNEALPAGASMMVSVSNDAQMTVTDGQLKDALTPSPITVTQTGLNLGEECVFVVAFLRPIDQGLPVCQEPDTIDETTTDDAYPFIQMSDKIVGVQCLAIDQDNIAVNVNDFVQEQVKDICGTFNLVVQIDPMGSFVGETSRCDNTKNLTVNFICETEEADMKMPMCEMVTNIFNPSDVAFMIRSMGMNKEGTQKELRRKLYNYEMEYGMDIWRESLASQKALSHDAKLHGYSLLKIIWKYIMDTKSEECKTVTDVKQALQNLEGLSQNEFTDVQDDNFNAAFQNKGNANIQSLLEAISSDGFGTLETRINKNITRAVYKSLIKSATTSMPDMEKDMEKDMHQMNKKVERIVKRVISQGTSIDDEELLHAVGNLTGIMVELKVHFTQNTCFNRVYDKLMNYIRNIKTSNTENLDADTASLFQNMEEIKKISGMPEGFPKKNASQLEVGGCIKRIDGYLDSKCKDYIDMTPEIKNNICLMNKFRQYISDKKDFLKFINIRRKLQKAEDEEDEDMMQHEMELKEDPLRMIAGNYAPWTMNDKGQFFKYMVNPTLDKVCMKKMATCQCQECHDTDMGGMGDSDGGMGGMGDSDGGMGGMGDSDDGMGGMGDSDGKMGGMGDSDGGLI